MPSHPLHGAVAWPKLITREEAVLRLQPPGLSRGATAKPPGCWAVEGKVFLMLLWMPFFRWCLHSLCVVPVRSLPQAASPSIDPHM